MSLIGEIINYYKLPAKIRASLAKYANAHRVIGDLDLYVSTAGDDSNDGLTVGAPFLTIQKAIDDIKTYIVDSDASVTINVAGGDYVLTSPISINTTQGENITILGEAPITTTILEVISVGAGTWTKTIVLEVGSTAGMSIGDSLLITNCDNEYVLGTPTGQSELNGVWDILSFPSTGRVAISFDHCYDHWAHGTETEYPETNEPGIGASSGDVRVLKTKIIGSGNFACIGVTNSKFTFDNLAIEHDTTDLLETARYGIIATQNSSIVLGSNMSFRKCWRGLNAHTGSTVYVPEYVVASANTTGFYANINAIFYFTGKTWSSNNLHGYYISIASTMTFSNRPRAYNNQKGISVYDGSTLYAETGITARKGYIGLVIQRNALAKFGTESRFGFNHSGVDCQLNSSVISGTGLGSQSNSGIAIKADQGGYVLMLSPGSVGGTITNYSPAKDTDDPTKSGNYIRTV